jgi:hypothetical protein
VTGSNLPYYPSAAVYNHSTGTIEVTGTVRSTGIGYGIQNNSSGAIAVAGDVYAGPNLPAIVSLSSAANVRIDGSQYGYPSPNGTSPGIVAVYSPSLCCVVNQLTIVQFARAGGASPVYETGESVTYYGLAAAGVSQASPADVRSGTVYGPSSELEGTLAVPAAGSVAMGVPVDATVGTAILTAALVRAAVGLAEANLDAQFAAITVDPQSIRDAMKLAPSAGAAAANSIDSKVEDRATPAAVAALLAAALDAP